MMINIKNRIITGEKIIQIKSILVERNIQDSDGAILSVPDFPEQVYISLDTGNEFYVIFRICQSKLVKRTDTISITIEYIILHNLWSLPIFCITHMVFIYSFATSQKLKQQV